jgi:hypothetical protein
MTHPTVRYHQYGPENSNQELLFVEIDGEQYGFGTCAEEREFLRIAEDRMGELCAVLNRDGAKETDVVGDVGRKAVRVLVGSLQEVRGGDVVKEGLVRSVLAHTGLVEQ